MESDEGKQGELLREGIAHYMEAKHAVGAFEELVLSSARRVLVASLKDIMKVVTLPAEHPTLSEIDVARKKNPEPQAPTIPVWAECPGGDGVGALQLGLRWWKEGKPSIALACLGIRVGAKYKRDPLFRSLTAQNSDPKVLIEPSAPSQWDDVFISRELGDFTIEDSMAKVVADFVALASRAGGLAVAMQAPK